MSGITISFSVTVYNGAGEVQAMTSIRDDNDDAPFVCEISTSFRPYSAQPQRDFYQPQEAIVKTAAPLASRTASSPNPPQPDYSPGDAPYPLPTRVELLYLL